MGWQYLKTRIQLILYKRIRRTIMNLEELMKEKNLTPEQVVEIINKAEPKPPAEPPAVEQPPAEVIKPPSSNIVTPMATDWAAEMRKPWSLRKVI